MNSFLNFIGFPFLPIMVGFFAFVFVKIRSADVDSSSSKKAIFEREQKALFAPSNDLPEEAFLYVNIDLPFDKINLNEKIASSVNRLKNEILSSDDTKLLKPNLDIRNIELKEKYGCDNLDEIIKYEKKYNRYITHLNSLSKILFDDEQYNVCEQFLLEAVEKDSEVSKTYIYLIDLYNKTDKQKLSTFMTEFKNKNIDNNNFFVHKVIEHYELIKSSL